MSKPIIMVAGMPRTGSMWTYNVARRLIRLSGHVPWPVHIPPDPIPAFRMAIRHGVADADIVCVKAHAQFEGEIPGLKVICNLRDPRDVLVSYMRFMRCGFDEAMESFAESLSLVDHYFGNARLDVLDVRYEDIMQKPAETVDRIAAFIGFPVSPEQSALIASDYARDKVRGYVDELGRGEVAGAEDQGGLMQRNADGSLRRYDETTGFQSGHVSDSVGGEWRNLLTPAQQSRLSAVTDDWLTRHGYAR